MQYPWCYSLGETTLCCCFAQPPCHASHPFFVTARHPFFVIARHKVPKQSQDQAHKSGQYQSIMTKMTTQNAKTLPTLIFEFCFSRDCHAFGSQRQRGVSLRGTSLLCHCEERRRRSNLEVSSYQFSAISLQSLASR